MKRSKRSYSLRAVYTLQTCLRKYYPNTGVFCGAMKGKKEGVLIVGVLSSSSELLSYGEIDKAYKEGKISELADGIAFRWKLGI